jgi:hypothetical protein
MHGTYGKAVPANDASAAGNDGLPVLDPDHVAYAVGQTAAAADTQFGIDYNLFCVSSVHLNAPSRHMVLPDIESGRCFI